jgi:hypothetical protein
MTSDTSPAPAPVVRGRWRRVRPICFWAAATVALSYVLSAYVFLPAAWRRQVLNHPAVATLPRVTTTGDGVPGDPLNVGLIGTDAEIVKLFTAAAWRPADPITVKSTLRLMRTTVLSQPYEEAPVSNLYLWGRKQDLAFQHPSGKNPRKRHHVRFWRSEDRDEEDRPLWVGAATYDDRVGLSHTNLQVTHHIDGDVDTERDKLFHDLERTRLLAQVVWLDDFHTALTGRNGGGDAYHTDGRFPVGVLGEPGDE